MSEFCKGRPVVGACTGQINTFEQVELRSGQRSARIFDADKNSSTIVILTDATGKLDTDPTFTGVAYCDGPVIQNFNITESADGMNSPYGIAYQVGCGASKISRIATTEEQIEFDFLRDAQANKPNKSSEENYLSLGWGFGIFTAIAAVAAMRNGSPTALSLEEVSAVSSILSFKSATLARTILRRAQGKPLK